MKNKNLRLGLLPMATADFVLRRLLNVEAWTNASRASGLLSLLFADCRLLSSFSIRLEDLASSKYFFSKGGAERALLPTIRVVDNLCADEVVMC